MDSMESNITETLTQLNQRFADALLPLTITFGTFVVVGSFGNILILLVFWLSKEYRNNNFKIFVICLALIDLVTCISLIPAEMVKHRNYFSFHNGILCKVKCFFNVFGACSSSFALLIISIDRFRRVCQPFKTQISLNLSVKLLVAFAFGVPLILAVPGTIMCGIETRNKTNIDGNVTEIFLCASSERFRKSLIRKIYKSTFMFLITTFSIVYIILYSCVMKQVVKQIKNIATLRRSSLYDECNSSEGQGANSVVSNVETKFSKQINDDKILARHFTKRGSKKEFRSFLTSSSRNGSMRTLSGSQRQPVKRLRYPYKSIVWFILTVLFVLTYIINVILTLNVANVRTMSPNQFAVYSFFYRIYFLNHVLNPLVYLLFLKSFRNACKSLLPSVKVRLQDIWQR